VTAATWQPAARPCASAANPLATCAACGRKLSDEDAVVLRSDGRLQCKPRCKAQEVRP
jgi:hypothetical protein